MFVEYIAAQCTFKKYMILDHDTLPYFLTDEANVLVESDVHAFLQSMWWRPGCTIEFTRLCLQHSYCFSVWTSAKTMIGFARCITDYCGYARYALQRLI